MTATQTRSGAREATTLPSTRTTIAAFWRMDFIEEISYPLSFALTLLRTAVPIVMFFFIGRVVGRQASVGGDYLTFTTIGLAITALMTGGMSALGGGLSRAFQRGNLETLLVEPVPWTFLPIAMNLWKTFLAVVNFTVLILLGAVLGANFIPSATPQLLIIAFLGLTSAMAIGVLSAAVLMLTLKSQPVLVVYTLVASIIGGSVFPVTVLPGWLQSLSYLIPHTYAINGARTVFTEDPGAFTISFTEAVLALGGFTIVVLPLGIWLFRRSLEFARRMGLLSGY